MSQLEDKEILHLAELSRVHLDASELESLKTQLPNIVDFVGQLHQASNIAGSTENPPKLLSELREDEVKSDALSLDDLGAIAPRWENDQVVVPPVLGEVENA